MQSIRLSRKIAVMRALSDYSSILIIQKILSTDSGVSLDEIIDHLRGKRNTSMVQYYIRWLEKLRVIKRVKYSDIAKYHIYHDIDQFTLDLVNIIFERKEYHEQEREKK